MNVVKSLVYQRKVTEASGYVRYPAADDAIESPAGCDVSCHGAKRTTRRDNRYSPGDQRAIGITRRVVTTSAADTHPVWEANLGDPI